MVCAHETSLERVYLSSLGGACPSDHCCYCSLCGVVEVRGNNRGKDTGYFIELLDRFQRYNSRRSKDGIRPLTEVEKRLIVQKMETSPLFNDPYGSSRHVQLHTFYQMLCLQRKQFTPEMLTEIILA